MPRPIVIIHGWSDRSTSFGSLRNYAASLAGNLFQINLADYVSMDDEVRFDDLVAGMQRAWTDLGLPTKTGAVDVVIHSTGGLVVRDWLATHYAPGAAPIKRLLMLAPANFGSPLAHKGRAFYGRIVKGFNSVKPFQTGTHILKGLELASPYSWNLALRDRFVAQNHFGPGRVLCTVLVGNAGYSGIMAAANEDGSDGTVRASTANLNCAMIEADFATNPLEPTYKLRNASGRTAFRILDNDNHSTAAMKDGGPKDPAGRELIARALTVSDEEFEAWCDQCAAETASITLRGEQDRKEAKFGYQNTVVRVVDDSGAPVSDYFLEFYLENQDDKKNRFAQLFHRDVMRSVHAYGDDSSYRSLMVDCTTLFREIDQDQEYMKISLTASPDFRTNGYVGYRTFTDKDIGGLRLTRQQMFKVFQPHRTLMVVMTIRRERAPEVFRIKRA
ncbi:MAG: hypothetical protein Q8J74_04785 [Candidatus Didemnitutus sp.]|nr:hypothetical protein [Candidatus Didemnitutus sp.]